TEYAGYLGKFTSNRLALLIYEDGGKLVRTPAYGLHENKQVRNIHGIIDEEGTLSLQAESVYSAIKQDNIHGMINYLSKEKVREYMNHTLAFPTYTINSFNYTPVPGSIPSMKESLNISVSNYATVTGKRLFIVPDIMTISPTKLTNDSVRKYWIKLDNAFSEIDSVEIILPEGYIVESIPQPVTLKSRFGNYSSAIQLTGNKIFYYRSLQQNEGVYPITAYKELYNFFQSVYLADRGTVVLVKK
ncbi:MAG TPA: hypothetical protein VK498_11760, partial [Ferruginibacter sp.]|nr:hypothetical protein [Ferruginibacter sp.]